MEDIFLEYGIFSENTMMNYANKSQCTYLHNSTPFMHMS